MNPKLFSALTIMILAIVLVSCNKNDNNPTPDIYRSWTVLQTDSQGQSYNVELRFNNDNTYDWILLDSVEGHTNSHAEFNIVDNVMVIIHDDDCSHEAEYLLVNEQDKLAIIAVTDQYSQRIAALEYIWRKK